MASLDCFHCGDRCPDSSIQSSGKIFCCTGCKTVFEILNEHDLNTYYQLGTSPGKVPEKIGTKFAYLDNEGLISELYEFKDDDLAVVNFFIPHIHCSSCIWILENLYLLHESVTVSVVDFSKKEVRVSFKHQNLSVRQLVELLSSIGYAPYLSLEQGANKKTSVDRSLLFKLGVAGFAFGNIMLLSFPEYFQTEGFWIERYQPLFRALIFCTILPVVFYAARDYFIAAYKGIKHGLVNIDVPITLGILVLFLRSSYEMFTGLGQGYFDSLAGFVFFLLLGKIFQQKTYNFLSFERDYRSYFPMAVTKIVDNDREISCAIYDVKKGDKLLIRNQELIPVDGMILSSETQIDYSFVTGESVPVRKTIGDKIFAGGKLEGAAIEMEVLQTISQSYLTQLWSNDIFKKDTSTVIENLTNAISKQFTQGVLLIALLTGIYWSINDSAMVANTVSAVLIVACPCALALSAPFALGNMLRILGREKIYLKNSNVIEKLASINCVLFDKTGTLTTKEAQINYEGLPLSKDELDAVKSVLRASTHPLSRSLYNSLECYQLSEVVAFKEQVGQGVEGYVNKSFVKIGSAHHTKAPMRANSSTAVHISIDHTIKGHYVFKTRFRNGLSRLFSKLRSRSYELGVLSGDNDSERLLLTKLLNGPATLLFDQKPIDKLNYIKLRQRSGEKVLMIGDGLNDAGALAQSDVGLSITEDINVFTPASDGIIDATKLNHISRLLALSRKTMKIIKISFLISLIYNTIGMYFAITGKLSPIVAAILMPMSSISVVAFVTIATNLISRKKSET